MRISSRGSLGLKYGIYWQFGISPTGGFHLRISPSPYWYVIVNAFMGLFFLPYISGCSGSRPQTFLNFLWGLILRVGAASLVHYAILVWQFVNLCSSQMENSGVDELVVHLDQALDLSSLEQGVKLIGKVLTSKLLNKWGVRNILRSAWKDLGKVDIKWARDNTIFILVQDESMASQILEQVS
ncbi:hypothetical protein EV1_021971 [Malus domestica]